MRKNGQNNSKCGGDGLAPGTTSTAEQQTAHTRCTAMPEWAAPVVLVRMGPKGAQGVMSWQKSRVQERDGEVAFPISRAQASPLPFQARQNLTGASLPQIRRGLARTWRLVLGSRIDEALGAIERD